MEKWSNLEISSFCSQMSLILQSGISSFEGISILLEETESPKEKEVLDAIYQKLLETGNFYQSLEASGVFPEYMLHMTDIGEQAGKLDEVMHSLADYYDREERMSRAIRSAVAYPLLMIGMMVAVIIILLTKVLPVFNQIFSQFGQEMTGFSHTLLLIGSTISNYAVVFIIILCVLVALCIFFIKTARGKEAFMNLSYHFRSLRNFYECSAACRFAGGMAFTLSSGLNYEYCIDLVAKLIDNKHFIKKIDICKQMMQEGSELSAALTKSGIFSGVYGRMISITSKTGALDSAMDDIAGKYEDELNTRLTNMIALLEPALVIILSVIVGFILLSVMLPLIGIMSSL